MNITDLPIEIQSKILINLPLHEILTCRLVNKELKYLVDNFGRLDRLLVGNDYCLEKDELNNFKPILYQHQNRNFDSKALRKPLFKCIRHLCIRTDVPASFDRVDTFEWLNFYSNLEHLKLSRLPGHLNLFLPEPLSKSSPNRLNLKRLKILEIDQIESGSLIFDLPSLTKLKIKDIGNVQILFVHPQSVKWVRVASYSAFVGQLVNLEYLFVDDLSDFSADLSSDFSASFSADFSGEQFTLEFTKTLKEFHFESKQLSFALLAKLKTQTKRSTGLKIYFNGVNINSLAGGEVPSTELICLHHTALADVLLFIETVDYSYIQNYFQNNLPKGLTGKFLKVNSIRVSERIKYESQLSTFLTGIIHLTELSLIGSQLNQRFYNDLSIQHPLVQRLTIVDDLQIVTNLNLSFLFSFSHLQTFITNKYIDRGQIESLFEQLNYLKVLKLKKGRMKLDVWRAEDGKLLVNDDQNPIRRFDVHIPWIRPKGVRSKSVKSERYSI